MRQLFWFKNDTICDQTVGGAREFGVSAFSEATVSVFVFVEIRNVFLWYADDETVIQ